MQLKKYTFLFIFIILPGVITLQAQIVSGELPPNFSSSMTSAKMLTHKIQSGTKTIKKPDISALQKEDAVSDQNKEIAWRFGVLNPVNLNLDNSGEWFHYANGQSLFRLRIKAKDAVSINLNFSGFFLSKKAKLFIYNAQQTDILGAITAKNNKIDSLFSTRPIRGSQITLELYVPTKDIAKNNMQISGVVYGYRDVVQKSNNKAFGASGNCQVDINCNEGNKWQEVKRSVVLILTSSNTRRCTGTLINNTAKDSIPYLITAAHCSLSSNSIFVFNYESPKCKPTSDPGITQSISGATYKASSGKSDFLLFELSQKPPLGYHAYYAGWNATDTTFLTGTCLHHPKGDVKKISFSNDTLLSDSYSSVYSNTHWKVGQWTYGSTEAGSSGSPLFNEDQHFVGQLQGGSSSCGYNLPDYYGKMFTSWDDKPQANRQLAKWLDPINSNQKILEGLDTKSPIFVNDIKVIGIYGPNNYICNNAVDLIFNFKNNGSDSIVNAKFHLKINNKDTTLNWSGNLAKEQVEKIALQNLALNEGNNQISINTVEVNGNNDLNLINDTAAYFIYANTDKINANLKIKTDDYGSETAWEIKSPEGFRMYEGGYYYDQNGGTVFDYDLCFYDSCFTLILSDLATDGFNGIYGDGYALITMGNDTVLYENNFTSTRKVIPFCINSSTGIFEQNNKNDEAIVISPNPIKAGEVLDIKSNVPTTKVSIFSVEGKHIKDYKLRKDNHQSINLPQNLSAGIYFLLLRDSNQNLTFNKIVVGK